MKQTYLQNEKNLFVNSFKNIYSRPFAYICIADAAYWGLFYLILFLFSAAITKAGAPLAALQAFSPGAANDTLRYFLIKAFLVFSLMIILIFLLWSFSRCIIWCRLLKEKFTFRRGFKFALFNLIWTIILFAPLALSVSSVYQKAKMNVLPTSAFFIFNYILLLFMAYLTYIFFFTFIRNKKIFSSFWEGICAASEKAPKLMPQYIAMLLVLLAASSALKLFSSAPFIYTALSFIVMIVSLSWAKMYFSAVLEDKLAKHKGKHKI